MTPADITRKAEHAMTLPELARLADTLLSIATRHPAGDVLGAEAAIRRRREYLESPEWMAKVMRA